MKSVSGHLKQDPFPSLSSPHGVDILLPLLTFKHTGCTCLTSRFITFGPHSSSRPFSAKVDQIKLNFDSLHQLNSFSFFFVAYLWRILQQCIKTWPWCQEHVFISQGVRKSCFCFGICDPLTHWQLTKRVFRAWSERIQTNKQRLWYQHYGKCIWLNIRANTAVASLEYCHNAKEQRQPLA